MRALRAHEGMQMQVRVQRSPHLLLSVTQIQGLQLIPPCACPGYPAGCSIVQQPDGGIVAEWHPACPGKGVPVVGGCQPQRTVQVRLGGTNVMVPLSDCSYDFPYQTNGIRSHDSCSCAIFLQDFHQHSFWGG